MFKSKSNNFKKKRNCFVYDNPDHYVSQCRKRVRNNNPLKTKINIKVKISLLQLFLKSIW